MQCQIHALEGTHGLRLCCCCRRSGLFHVSIRSLQSVGFTFFGMVVMHATVHASWMAQWIGEYCRCGSNQCCAHRLHNCYHWNHHHRRYPNPESNPRYKGGKKIHCLNDWSWTAWTLRVQPVE